MAPKPPPTAKKAKLFNSRTIRSENADPSLKDGILNLPQFLAARQYEILAFEQSQLNTKSASATRVFQSLPRTLRRRTASHNVKRIPKRLRARALKEMQNTLNGVPKKRLHLRGRELYKLRMRKRLLLVASKIKMLRGVPAVQHAPFKEQLKTLNAQIADLKLGSRNHINNAVGAYDRCLRQSLLQKPTGNMKYGKRQRQFTWLPTHMWHAKRFHMMKQWGFQIPFSPNQKCFRSTSRADKNAALAFDTSYYCELILNYQTDEMLEQVLHEFTKYSAAIPDWLTQGSRVYTDWIYQGGSKVAPGSLVVAAKVSCICIRIHPMCYEDFFCYATKWAPSGIVVSDARYALGSIEVRGPEALKSLGLILHTVPSQASDAWKAFLQRDHRQAPSGTCFALLAADPRFWKHPSNIPRSQIPDKSAITKASVDEAALQGLFTEDGRTNSYKEMYSIKQLGQEFARHDPSSTHIHGPSRMPVFIYKMPNDAWCIWLPWFWVQPLWSKYISISSVKPGGLRQMHQLNFEYGRPTYPIDFPHLPQGYAEYIRKSQALSVARAKLPASKQVPSKTTEPHLSLDADWYFLRKWVFGLMLLDDEKSSKLHHFGEFESDKSRVIRNSKDLAIVINSGRSLELHRIPLVPFSKRDPMHTLFVENRFTPNVTKFPQLPIVLVSLTLLAKGHMADNARIYSELGEEPLKNLIGFVTLGAFNFQVGQPTGVGLVSARYKAQRKVWVRNVGCTSFHPAEMKLA